MIAGVLGVLAAGGAYLPLDPSHPDERLAALLEDARPAALLTQERLAPRFAGRGPGVLLLDAAAAGPAEPEASPWPRRPALPGQPAYVIYTSGSTGRPKGVVTTHGSLAAYTAAAIDTYRLGPGDRVLQFASLGFDTSAEEIFPTLACGATLVLRSEEMLASPDTFLDECGRLGITVLDLPTAYWHLLAAHLCAVRRALPESLRLVILGGERALPERVEAWRAQVGRRPLLLNTYGPTEATIVATAADLSGPYAGAGSGCEVPIGRPFGTGYAHVLDATLSLVPLGAAGELCLGGEGLARGYLRRPAWTAERFVPSPFSASPGDRLYRTGDRVRRFADGNLEYLGRLDLQVKVRGFRVELGEIEAVLSSLPGVEAAVVVAREKTPGDLQLLAYAAVPEPGTADAESLRRLCKKRLPAYMVPSSLVVLAKLPLNSSGKVDRRALPVPDTTGRELEEGFVPPETEVEEILAGIWRELLDVGQVSVFDNFFDLGGHSLLVPQLFARVHDAFQVELPLRVLFEAPTVGELALVVEERLLEEVEALGIEEGWDVGG